MMKQHTHSDLTTDQFAILQYIHKQGKTTATDIATTFGVGKSAITAFVNRLMHKELITRRRNERDRRIIYLSLTEQGALAVKETEKAIHLFLIEKLEEFDIDDIDRFLQALEKLAHLTEIQKIDSFK